MATLNLIPFDHSKWKTAFRKKNEKNSWRRNTKRFYQPHFSSFFKFHQQNCRQPCRQKNQTDIGDKNSIQSVGSVVVDESLQVVKGVAAQGTLHFCQRWSVNCLIIMEGFSPLSHHHRKQRREERHKVHWSRPRAHTCLQKYPSAADCSFSLNRIDWRMTRRKSRKRVSSEANCLQISHMVQVFILSFFLFAHSSQVEQTWNAEKSTKSQGKKKHWSRVEGEVWCCHWYSVCWLLLCRKCRGTQSSSLKGAKRFQE